MKAEITGENISKLEHKDQVKFALFCAKQVIHLARAPEAKECIRVVELWLDGKATVDECKTAANAASHITRTATYVAARAAYTAVYAAYSAANVAYVAYSSINADESCRQKIEEYLYELIYIDDIIEQTLLGVT